MRRLPALLIAAALLSGCQTFPMTGKPWKPDKFKPDITCGPKTDCKTWVNPLNDWVPETIEVLPDLDEKGSKTPRKIVWYSLWVFESGGVLFDEAGRRYIRCEQRGPWKVECTIDPTVPPGAKYKYLVDVLNYDPVDPWVLNR